jgi:hypothetical protein
MKKAKKTQKPRYRSTNEDDQVCISVCDNREGTNKDLAEIAAELTGHPLTDYHIRKVRIPGKGNNRKSKASAAETKANPKIARVIFPDASKSALRAISVLQVKSLIVEYVVEP